MDGLISVDEARAYAREHWPSPVVRRQIESLLDNCPRVETATVQHGQWLDDGSCSVCRKVMSINLDGKSTSLENPNAPYCPYCGTIMDFKEECPCG